MIKETISKINKLFSKNEEEITPAPSIEYGQLTLTVDNLVIGHLSCENGKWHFKYSGEFKEQNEYHSLIGFPSLDEEYVSEHLWPFFKIRIPGLKQPAIREIVEDENIDSGNEFELLKRFGKRTISNPYELI